MHTLSRRLAGALSVLALGTAAWIAATPVAAAQSGGEESFLGYRKMVFAASSCRYPALDVRYNEDATDAEKAAADAAQARIAALIEEKTGADLSAADKLFLIEKARDEVRGWISSKGCKAPEVTALVERFEQEFPGVAP